MRRGMLWFVISLLTALSACEDEVVQVNFPTDASPDRAAEGGSARADAAALDEAPANEIDAPRGDEPRADDGGKTAGD